MRCPGCGAENEEGARYCGLCYRSFEATRPVGESPSVGPGELSSTPLGTPAWRQVAGRKKKYAWTAAALAALAIVALIVAIPLLSREKRKAAPRQYVSTVSPLSFKYPGDWEEMSGSELLKSFKGYETTPGAATEVNLMERGSTMFKYLLLVSSAPAGFDASSLKETGSSLEEMLYDSAAAQGLEPRFFELDLPAGSGAIGLGLSYDMKGKAALGIFHLEAYIYKGDTSYVMRLLVPHGSGDLDEGEARLVFNDVVGSVRFAR